AARRVSLAFAGGTVVLLYLVSRQLGGVVAGLAAVGLVLSNPLLSTLWTRALAEAPLAFFSVLAVWLAVGVIHPARSGRIGIGAPSVAGASLGLAAATKLSGAIAGLGLVLLVALEQVVSCWRRRRRAALRHWMILGL